MTFRERMDREAKALQRTRAAIPAWRRGILAQAVRRRAVEGLQRLGMIGDVLSDKPVRILSLGAGVQSSTIVLMMHKGELPPADAAIFADTGAEPKRTYQWLDWLTREVAGTLPVVRSMFKDGLTKGIEGAVDGSRTRCAPPPFFTTGGGQVRRHCTGDFKIDEIKRTARRIFPDAQSRGLVQIIGFSTDESTRCFVPDAQYIRNEYPLIDLGMSRRECMRWCVLHDYPMPPRSACVYCPYRSNWEWREMREACPDDWAEACRVDALIRKGLPGFRETPFVHRSLAPLAEADLRDEAEKVGQSFMWPNRLKCHGLCWE